jgi:hypothetical protein
MRFAVPIQSGPGYATGGSTQSNPSTSLLPTTLPQTPTPTATIPTVSAAAADVETNSAQNQPVAYTETLTTTTPTRTSASNELSTLSTLYYTTGNRIDEVIVVEETVTVLYTSTVTIFPGDVQPTYRKRSHAVHRRYHGGGLH